MDASSDSLFRAATVVAYFGGWVLVRLYFQWKLGQSSACSAGTRDVKSLPTCWSPWRLRRCLSMC